MEEGATSIINTMEAEFVLWLYMCALPACPAVKTSKPASLEPKESYATPFARYRALHWPRLKGWTGGRSHIRLLACHLLASCILIYNYLRAGLALRELTARYTHLRTSNQIAVISPYSAQVAQEPAP